MAKNILSIKNVFYNKNVNLHLHSSTLVDAVNNDWASHLAFHIQVVLKVMRNFTNSFMKHPPEKTIERTHLQSSRYQGWSACGYCRRSVQPACHLEQLRGTPPLMGRVRMEWMEGSVACCPSGS